MSTRAVAPDGSDLAGEPDVSIIRPGVTTRAEVLDKFRSVDSGWRSDGLFIGRWAHSAMGNIGDRQWGGRNLVVTFDANGLVQHIDLCGDGHLVRILSDVLRSDKTARRSGSLVESIQRLGGQEIKVETLVIETDSMHLGDDEIQRDQVKKIRFPHLTFAKSGRPDPRQIGYILWLRREIRGYHEVELLTTIPVLVDIIQFLNAPAPNSAKPVTH